MEKAKFILMIGFIFFSVITKAQNAAEPPPVVQSETLSAVLGYVFEKDISKASEYLREHVKISTDSTMDVDYKYELGRLTGILFYVKKTGRIVNQINFIYGSAGLVDNVPIALSVNGKETSLKGHWMRMQDIIIESQAFLGIEKSMELVDAHASGNNEDFRLAYSRLAELLSPQFLQLSMDINKAIDANFDDKFELERLQNRQADRIQKRVADGMSQQRIKKWAMNIVGASIVLIGAGVVNYTFNQIETTGQGSFRALVTGIGLVLGGMYNLYPVLFRMETKLHEMLSTINSIIQVRLMKMDKIKALRKIGHYSGRVELKQRIATLDVEVVQTKLDKLSADAAVVPHFWSNLENGHFSADLSKLGAVKGISNYTDRKRNGQPPMKTGEIDVVESGGGLSRLLVHMFTGTTDRYGSYWSTAYGRQVEVDAYRAALANALTAMIKDGTVSTLLIPIDSRQRNRLDAVLATQLIFQILSEMSPQIEKSNLKKVIIYAENKTEFESARAAIKSFFYDKITEITRVFLGESEQIKSCMVLFR